MKTMLVIHCISKQEMEDEEIHIHYEHL